MFTTKKMQEDEYDVYRMSAKGHFNIGEGCKMATIPQIFGQNQEHDITSEFQAKVFFEAQMHYAQAAEYLLQIPDEKRTIEDERNLCQYFEKYGEMHNKLGFPKLGEVIKAQGKEEVNESVLQLSDSMEMEELKEVSPSMRKR